ncbi:hypothetical protein roselon_00231 [Roseibacterium elongatum DSM 19469]|uniref:Uncharacterized protein n=1 Tax=Roseicyclus elongatus DSM 19469 TaxID=1294273 RepID=W8RNV5_9RHOB|nr:hypothetical protein roselon_00231 [Roseibacterium elongatum DSM 19469]
MAKNLSGEREGADSPLARVAAAGSETPAPWAAARPSLETSTGRFIGCAAPPWGSARCSLETSTGRFIGCAAPLTTPPPAR